MTSLAAEKIETIPGLHSCFTCADNLGCNLEPRCESMEGCIKWRCRVCRAPWWTVGYNHETCNATGVPNGVTYHDGTHMAPLPEASGHYYRHGGILQGDNIVAGQTAPIEKNYLVGGTYYFGGRFGGLSFLSIKLIP